MLYIDLAQIDVSENRIRKHFDENEMEELRKSISSKGLLHPPVVREKENGRYELVVGERRLRAIDSLLRRGEPIKAVRTEGDHSVPEGKVPVSLLSEMPAWQIREVELEENIIRQDITWQERVRAVAEIHEMWKREHGEETWTTRDTAEKVYDDLEPSSARRKVNEDILLAKNLDDDMVARAENPKVAMKMLRRQREEQLSASFADFLQDTIEAGEQVDLREGDCIDGMAAYEGEPIDLFLMDPPYGIGAQDFNQGDMHSVEALYRHSYEDAPEAFQNLMSKAVERISGLAAEQSAVYQFCDIRQWEYLVGLYRATGWHVWPWPLIYYKRGKGLAPSPEYGPQRRYEMILYANRRKKKLRQVRSDVIGTTDSAKIEEEKDYSKFHAAAKPVWLLKDLIERTCYSGERICDPFMGSGSTAIAAYRLGMFFLGWEKDSDMYKRALVRCQSEQSNREGK